MGGMALRIPGDMTEEGISFALKSGFFSRLLSVANYRSMKLVLEKNCSNCLQVI